MFSVIGVDLGDSKLSRSASFTLFMRIALRLDFGVVLDTHL